MMRRRMEKLQAGGASQNAVAQNPGSSQIGGPQQPSPRFSGGGGMGGGGSQMMSPNMGSTGGSNYPQTVSNSGMLIQQQHSNNGPMNDVGGGMHSASYSQHRKFLNKA